jgi:hypothetical protein
MMDNGWSTRFQNYCFLLAFLGNYLISACIAGHSAAVTQAPAKGKIDPAGPAGMYKVRGGGQVTITLDAGDTVQSRQEI